MSAIQRTALLSVLLLAGCSSQTQTEVATTSKQPQDVDAGTTDSDEVSDATPSSETPSIETPPIETPSIETPPIEASPDDDTPGIAIGGKAPEFSLKNQANEDISLSDLLKERNVAIVFYRSADW